MANFNDAADPVLGAACNRLASFCEALPADALIDVTSGLTEGDLVLILRRLHATRHGAPDTSAAGEAAQGYERPSVPLTKR